MLEAFSSIGSADLNIRRTAGCQVYTHVLTNSAELEYAVTRLIRGLESNKVTTRTGSYSTLASFLDSDKLKATELREIVGKTLLTDHQTTKKERRLVYIARILSCGVILRIVPFSQLVLDEELVRGVLHDLVDLGGKRSTLLELATPFICHIINEKEMTKSVFEDLIWPSLEPLFINSEIKAEEDEENKDEENKDEEKSVGKDISSASLHIALTCFDKELKTDFECLTDINQVVRILLSHRVTNVLDTIGLVARFAKRQDLIKEMWNALVEQMRSSHFDTICLCVQKSIEAGIAPDIIARQEIITPLLGVFRNDDAPEQHSQSVKTLSKLLKWSNDKETKMKKKQRKHVLKALFGDSPSLLHEYQKLLHIIKPFLAEVCTEKDLTTLGSIIENQLKENTLSVRISIVYLQFLSRIGQAKKAPADLKVTISKQLLSIGYGIEKLSITKSNDDKIKDETTSDSPKKAKTDKSAVNDKETDQLISKTAIESFRSLIGSTYNSDYFNEIYQFVIDNLDAFCKEKSLQKLFKKADKQRNKTEDANLKYILGSYAIRLILEQDKVLGEAKEIMDELLEIVKSPETEDAVTKIMEFMFSSVMKDEQPPFDYEAMFSRLVFEDKVSDNIIQQFADIIDVDVNDAQNGDEDSSEESSEEENVEGQEQMEIEPDSEEIDEEEKETKIKRKMKRKSKAKSSKHNGNGSKDSDSDEEPEVDMDQETEEDLQIMDKALAKVFATKRKVKEEETSEIRSLMRTFKLLELMISRNTKGCNISIPLILLIPIVNSLQHSIRGKNIKKNSTTRIVSVLNKLNAIKKVQSVDSVDKGILLTMARDLVVLLKQRKNKFIKDLLCNSVVMLAKCYLQGSRTKGEDTGFISLFTGLLDLKRSKNMRVASNMKMSLVLAILEKA